MASPTPQSITQKLQAIVQKGGPNGQQAERLLQQLAQNPNAFNDGNWRNQVDQSLVLDKGIPGGDLGNEMEGRIREQLAKNQEAAEIGTYENGATPRTLEGASRSEALRQLMQVAQQTGVVNSSQFGGNLPLEQEFARQRIAEAAQAARDLGNPVTNQEGIDAALAEQGGATRKIGIADLVNADLQGQQFGEYGGDIELLRRTAKGEGPSAAEALAKLQRDDAIRSMSAVAGTARGGNIAAGMRGAMRAGTDLTLRSQQQIAALRAQEQLQAQQQLAQAQAQRATAINAARGTDVTRAVGAASAFDATTGRQLSLGELETQRQAGRAQMLGAAGQTQLEATNTAAEIARNEEDTRQSRARLALEGYNTLTNQGMAPVNRDAQQRHETAIVKRGEKITPRDIFGGVMSAVGLGVSGLGSIFKPAK